MPVLKYFTASDTVASTCTYSFTYTNIDTSRARVLILRVSRGWRLSTHIYSIYIWRRCHAGSEWSSHSRNAPPHARTHTTRTHAGPQTHAHAHSNPRIGHPASADRVGLAWHILSSVAGDQRVFAKMDMLHARICICCLLMRPFVSPQVCRCCC